MTNSEHSEPVRFAFKAATITLSDRAASGLSEDRSGPLLRQLLAEAGADLVPHRILPDDRAALSALLIELSAAVDVVVTTGGTGIAPRDFTPEATADILDKRLPGIEESLRAAGRGKVPTAVLSRGAAGVRGRCLIVNLPGSPGAVRDGMAVLTPVLPHAVRLLRSEVRDCQAELPGEP